MKSSWKKSRVVQTLYLWLPIYRKKMQEKMTDISLIQARDDGHLGERQQLLEKQRKGLSSCWQEGPRKLSQDLWGLAPKHSRTLASCSAWEPRAPQLGLILHQPCSEQECCVYLAGRVQCIDLTGRARRTWWVLLHGCKQQSGDLLVQLHRPHPSCTEKVLGLLWDFGIFCEICSGHRSCGYCTFNPHIIKIQSPGWT